MIEPLESRIAPAVLIFGKQIANGVESRNLVATASDGSTYVVGVFAPGVDLDAFGVGTLNLSTSDAAGDVYLAKYDSAGNLLWQHTWGGLGVEDPEALIVDANNDLYVTGGFASTNVGFDGVVGTLSSVSGDIFVLKVLGSDGTPVNAFGISGQVQWGGTGGEYATSIAIDSLGHLIIGGASDSNDAVFNGATTSSFPAAAFKSGLVLRIDQTSGAADTSFGSSGVVLITSSNQVIVQHLAVQLGNDNIYAAAEDYALLRHSVTRLSSSSGALDATYSTSTSLTIPQSFPNSNFGFSLYADRGVVSEAKADGQLVLTALSDLGAIDPDFNTGSPLLLNVDVAASTLINDGSGNHYVVGTTADLARNYVARVLDNGDLDTTFAIEGIKYFGKPAPGAVTQVGAALTSDHVLMLRGTYSGNPDLDATNERLNLAARTSATLGTDMVEGYLLRFDPNALNAANPLAFVDETDDKVTVTMSGPGYAHYELNAGKINRSDLSSVQLYNTTLSSSIKVAMGFVGSSTTVGQISTTDPSQPQDVGQITLGANVQLGGGNAPTPFGVTVSGKMNKLVLDKVYGDSDQLRAVKIKLGEKLPYNAAPASTSDTYNNHPDLTLGDVGENVIIDVTGDGTDGGTGGGGLGTVIVNSWGAYGLIKTTQSVGSFTVKNGDFYGVLELDPGHHGALTTADLGAMNIQNGAWGSAGTEIEGSIASFSAEAFLANATITAATIKKIKVSGDFDGTMTLTASDPDSASLGLFTVTSDFTGKVVASGPLKNLVIKGDFKGSLTAPSVGSITAYQFLGATGDVADPRSNITITSGTLGTLKATAGGIQDYEITAAQAFKGMTVKLSKLTASTTAIDNVRVTAASIGNISVSLAVAKNTTSIFTGISSTIFSASAGGIGNISVSVTAGKYSSALNSTGIETSTFETAGHGATSGTFGNIGNVTITLLGAAGAGSSSVGILQTSFDARVGNYGELDASTLNAIGKMTIKLSNSGGDSIGLKSVDLFSNKIGITQVTVSGKGALATAHALENVNYSADLTIGAFSASGAATQAQATSLNLWAGGTIGAVNIKANSAFLGNLISSHIAAGQLLDLTNASDLQIPTQIKNAALGAVTISGSISASSLVAGSNIGAVTIGLLAVDTSVIAGATLGADHLLGGANDLFQRIAAIKSVSVKGTESTVVISAGIDPKNGTFGDGDDEAAAAHGAIINTSSIGAIVLKGSGTVLPATLDHAFVIQAAAIKSLKIGTLAPVLTFTDPIVIDTAGNGEDGDDILVRLK